MPGPIMTAFYKIPVENVNVTILQYHEAIAKKDPTRCPKNLPHVTFEDERCKHLTFAQE